MKIEFVNEIKEITLNETANVWVNISGNGHLFDLDSWQKVNLGREKKPTFKDIKDAILLTFQATDRKFKPGVFLVSDKSPENGLNTAFVDQCMGVRFRKENRENSLEM